MKLRTILLAALLTVAAASRAQYYEIANQLTNLVSPALSGSAAYKGFVDASVTAGLGQNRAAFYGISTSQGFQYTSWFFMGAGAGVDIAVANLDEYERPSGNYPGYFGHTSSQTKAMVPVFSDFRFTIGSNPSAAQAFIDLKIGATWLIGSSYLELRDARLGTGAQFYFKPQIGVRIPVSTSHPRQAINAGLTYQLITSGSNYYWDSRSVSLNNIGLTLAFEW